VIETLTTGYMNWWTISPQMYHTASNQCFYHWVDTSTGGLLVLEDIIHPVVDPVIETLITGCMIHLRTNSPPVELSNTDYWVYDTLED
jgi:hypothetical protein